MAVFALVVPEFHTGNRGVRLSSVHVLHLQRVSNATDTCRTVVLSICERNEMPRHELEGLMRDRRQVQPGSERVCRRRKMPRTTQISVDARSL